MNSQQSEKQPTKLASIVGWTLGSIFALTGIGMISSDPLPAIIMCAMAAILIPTVSQQIEQKLKIKISTSHKAPLILIGVMLFGWTVEKKENTPPNKVVSPTPTVISTTATPVNTQVATIDPPVTITPTPTSTAALENTNSTLTEAPTDTANAQASIAPTITAPPTSAPEPVKLLGISYNQIMKGLADTFSLENSPLRDGRTRYIGNSPNNLQTLEIIGEKKNVEEITLIIFVPEEDPGLVVARINALILIQTVFPDWTESNNWFEDARLKITKDYKTHESSHVEKVYGDISMTLSGSKLLNALTLTVKHK